MTGVLSIQTQDRGVIGGQLDLHPARCKAEQAAYNDKREHHSSDALFLRFQPDSNWCGRFCRPLPNHSDMEPCMSQSVAELRCKVTAYFQTVQIFQPIFLTLRLEQTPTIYQSNYYTTEGAAYNLCTLFCYRLIERRHSPLLR